MKLKTQAVPTFSLGELTLSSLTLSDLRELDNPSAAEPTGKKFSFDFLPHIARSVRKIHQDITETQLAENLTADEYNALLVAMLEVSGIKKSENKTGEAPALASGA